MLLVVVLLVVVLLVVVLLVCVVVSVDIVCVCIFNIILRTLILLLCVVSLDTIAIFFTNPTGAPSGVSDGHKYPQLVPCNLRGLTILPLLPVLSLGEFTRRKCDIKL